MRLSRRLEPETYQESASGLSQNGRFLRFRQPEVLLKYRQMLLVGHPGDPQRSRKTLPHMHRCGV